MDRALGEIRDNYGFFNLSIRTLASSDIAAIDAGLSEKRHHR
jgi:hypothetical protein